LGPLRGRDRRGPQGLERRPKQAPLPTPVAFVARCLYQASAIADAGGICGALLLSIPEQAMYEQCTRMLPRNDALEREYRRPEELLCQVSISSKMFEMYRLVMNRKCIAWLCIARLNYKKNISVLPRNLKAGNITSCRCAAQWCSIALCTPPYRRNSTV
jgi:hypothetical protein